MSESAAFVESSGHLRQVLAATAICTGLHLRPSTDHGIPSTAQALDAAYQLKLPTTAKAAIMILVDGLGLEILQERKGHAPTLRGLLNNAVMSGLPTQLTTCTPSTTAAALTTLGTGALPGKTGMVGYSVRHPRLAGIAQSGPPEPKQLLNLITWENSELNPRLWQDTATVFERLCDSDGNPLIAVSVGPARFAGSGLTEAGLRGTQHCGVNQLENRPAAAIEALKSGCPLVYFYVGELDHAGHRYGWKSPQWLAQLERLDAVLAELLRRAPKDTLIALSADHGMVDTQPEHRIDICRNPMLAKDVAVVAGEPRFLHLFVQTPSGGEANTAELAKEVAKRWQAELGDRAAWIGTKTESAVLLGELSERAENVVGDVVVAMNGNWVVVDSHVHSETVQNMPGVHGSITSAETAIPLLRTLI